MCPVPFALSSLLGRSSGSAGGVTATGNQHARYFIARPAHTDPNTVPQRFMRTAMTRIAARWELLTVPQKLAWERHAEVSQRVKHNFANTPVHLTGRIAFCRHNIPRYEFTGSFVTGPPNRLGEVAFGPVRLTYTRGVFPQPNLKLTFETDDEWNQTPNSFLLVHITVPVPATWNFYERAFLFRRTVSQATSPASFTYNLVIGTNQRLFCKVRAITSDGRTSKAMHVRSTP